MEVLLEALLPDLLAGRASHKVIVFNGKQDLQKKLPQRLPAYAKRVCTEPLGVVVLIDRDSEDCKKLKRCLESKAASAGLATKTAPSADGFFHVVNRIVVDELEAWLLGDVQALCAAYPRLPEGLGRQAKYRDPDAIKGGSKEQLRQELSARYPTFLPTLEMVRAIAPHLDPARNRSQSFQTFVSGLDALVARAQPAR